MLSLTPLATVLLSLPLARAHTGLYRLLVSGLFLTGALILARPALLFSGHQGYPLSLPLSFPSTSPLGLASALAAALLSAHLLIVARQVKEGAHIKESTQYLISTDFSNPSYR
jgi:hypothetical protein